MSLLQIFHSFLSVLIQVHMLLLSILRIGKAVKAIVTRSVCLNTQFLWKSDNNRAVEIGINCLDVKLSFIFVKAAVYAIGSCSLVFMIHVIFRTILVGLFGTFLHSFAQDGTSNRFDFYATEKIVVLLIWGHP